MWGVSYWVFPLLASIIWLAMLLGMFLTWVVDGKTIYSTMGDGQTIPYISDIGSHPLKPLFIAMSTATVVIFNASFIFERWLRHTGRLTRNTSLWQKTCALLSIIAALAGGVGLILLTIFDNKNHNREHNIFLAIFIAGYIISAIFICIQYQRLGFHYRDQRILCISFWIKLFFIIVEVCLAIAFGVTQRQKHRNAAAILEWIVALIYTFYVLSFFVDFIPAVHNKKFQSTETSVEAGMAQAQQQQEMAETGGSEERLHQSPPRTRYPNF